ncbi:MAG: ATP-binding protein, partial [Saprospiraceae bacterium]
GTFSHNNRFLWIGLGLGKILRFDKMKEKTEFITYKSQGKTSSFSTIIALECDLKNNIWVGDPSGLTKIEKAASDRPEYIYYEANKNGKALRSGHILSIEEDPISPKDFLWVGTKGGGLHKLNKSEGTFENLTEKDGLPNNVIYSILSHKDKLWMSTNKGLSEFNIKEKSFRNYTMDNGLQENEFNTNAYHKSQDGEFFFGGINGLNRFYPDSISSNNIPASITLTNLEVNNHIITPQDTTGILRQPIEHHKAIELTHNQNIISLEFAVLDFTSKSENEYKYMMEGVNKDWVFSKENKAYYTNLSAGSYTFKVNGRNSNGAWHTEGISLEIIVHPPWWASNIAYAFYFISILITSYLIIRFQINRWKLKKQLAFEQKESERKEELDKMKTQFFSNITHEFRTPLTLIIEPIKQLIQDYNDPVIVHKLSLVEKNSSQLLHLVNQLLDLSKLESKKMQIELHQGDILDSIIPIVQSFEFLAQRKNIELRLNTPLKINAFDFDKKKIEKILYNLISNAIKYTPQGGKVEVTAYIKEGSFKLKIKDSGVGIPEHLQESIFKRFFQVDGTHTREAQGTGIGLSLVRELVQLMNGKIKVKSTEGKGSLFSVNIPIQTQQEKNADISGNALLES